MTKTSFIIIAFLFISTPFNLVAKDLGPYVEEYSRLIEAGKHNESMAPAGEIIDIFIAGQDFNNALKFAKQLTQATSPTMARFGYFQQSKVYYSAYKATQSKKHLIPAGASLILYSTSNEAIALLQLYSEHYGVDQDTFLELVVSKSDTMSVDKTLASAIAHIQNERWEITSALIINGHLPVNAKQSSDGASMLHMAVWFNKFEAIKQLVEFHHADINIRDNEGDTPLGYAKHKGNSSIEQYLKKNGGTL